MDAGLHAEFVAAIQTLRKVRVTFYSERDGGMVTHVCAPMDFGPSRKKGIEGNRYHFWSYIGDEVPHTMPLTPGQIVRMDVLDERFSPADFVTWDTRSKPWFVGRDWGEFS